MEPSFPIARDAAGKLGLDYLALGHYHSTATYSDESGATRMAYCGTQEPTAFGERDSGNVLLVEISKPGAVPMVEKVRTRSLDWLTYGRRMERGTDVQKLAAELETIGDPEHTLVNCEISGELPDDDEESIHHLEELVLTRFLYGRFSREALALTGGGDQWIESLPPGYLQNTALRLRQQSQSSEDTAAAALRVFRRLWSEVRP
jgi:hypothetical protein